MKPSPHTFVFTRELGARLRDLRLKAGLNQLELARAMGLGSAGEMKTAMGVVLIGGLIFGMVVTMIIVPVSFLSFDKLRTGFERQKVKLPEEK